MKDLARVREGYLTSRRWVLEAIRRLGVFFLVRADHSGEVWVSFRQVPQTRVAEFCRPETLIVKSVSC